MPNEKKKKDILDVNVDSLSLLKVLWSVITKDEHFLAQSGLG